MQNVLSQQFRSFAIKKRVYVPNMHLAPQREFATISPLVPRRGALLSRELKVTKRMHRDCRTHIFRYAPRIRGAARNLSFFCMLMLTPAIFAQDKPRNPASATTPVLPRHQPYAPISGQGRLRWFVKSTVGLESLAGGIISAAWGTGFDNPREYGPGWEGFGKRYGMRLTGVSTGNAMEAAAGALWGEDPRYFRAAGQPFGARVKNIIRFTFVAYRRDGSVAPAYARFAANAGNNFLSNTWRAHSESDSQHAVIRIGEGVLGKMAANAFAEFWPDAKRLMFRRH